MRAWPAGFLGLTLAAGCTGPVASPTRSAGEPRAAAVVDLASPRPVDMGPDAPPDEPDPPCTSDASCGYDPARRRCRNDPRANPQPLLVDQGIVCWCDDAARSCETLRVPPVACEGDAYCAVRADPRPHPVAADATHPHEREKPCRDFKLATTCERTNICTLHRLACAKP